jgi:hypothetical protein
VVKLKAIATGHAQFFNFFVFTNQMQTNQNNPPDYYRGSGSQI